MMLARADQRHILVLSPFHFVLIVGRLYQVHEGYARYRMLLLQKVDKDH